MPSQLKSILLIALIAAACVALIGFVGIYFKPRDRKALSSCINNLRQLEGAKDQWAIENKKTTNDIPNWSDVDPFFKKRPTCPEGGTYTLGFIGKNAKCSIGKGTHVLE